MLTFSSFPICHYDTSPPFFPVPAIPKFGNPWLSFSESLTHDLLRSWPEERCRIYLCLRVGSLREHGHSDLHIGKHDGMGVIIVPYTELSNSLPIFKSEPYLVGFSFFFFLFFWGGGAIYYLQVQSSLGKNYLLSL